MVWPWEWEQVEAVRRKLEAVERTMEERMLAVESRLAELGRAQPEDEPTALGLPPVVRGAVDETVSPFAEDRASIRVRGRLIRGARVRLRAGRTDAQVADWVRTGEDE